MHELQDHVRALDRQGWVIVSSEWGSPRVQARLLDDPTTSYVGAARAHADSIAPDKAVARVAAAAKGAAAATDAPDVLDAWGAHDAMDPPQIDPDKRSGSGDTKGSVG